MKSYKNHLISTQSYGESHPVDYRPTMRSSAVFPVHYKEGEIDTEATFLGYWLLKRNIREVCALLTLRDEHGNKVHIESKIIDSARSYNWRIGDIAKDKGLGPAFFGSIEFEIFSTRDMVFPYPAITFSYIGKLGRSFVHTCGRIFNDFDDLNANDEMQVPETGFDLLPGEDFDPFFSFVNGPIEIRDGDITLEFLNVDGGTLTKRRTLEHVPPYGTAWVDIFSDEEERRHLGGTPGTVKISHDLRGFFPRFVVGNTYRNNSAISLTHSYYDTSGDVSEGAIWTNPDKAAFHDSTISFPVPREFERTEFVVYPIYRSHPAKLIFEFYEADGSFIFRDEETRYLSEGTHSLQYIDCRDIAARHDIDRDLLLCRVIIDGDGQCPTRLKFGLNFSSPAKIDMPSNICFGAKVANEKIANKPGTFKWCTLFDTEHEKIYLTNTGFTRASGKAANIKVDLRRQSDDVSLNWELDIPWNGVLEVIGDKRGELEEFLQGEVGWISFQASNPFLDGYYATDHGSGLIGADHLY